MKESLRALLAHVVDYAGLFPPAALPLEVAIRNYASYRRGEHAWMLGRLVVPAGQMSDVPRDFPLSVLGPAVNDVVELKAASVDDVAVVARRWRAMTTPGPEEVPSCGATAYVEIADAALLDAIAANGLRAKIRTGGLTPDAFPPAEAVAAFIRRCAALKVAFKATAGLHHPLRCVRPLTYDAGAPRGTMHGFINVFLAAALLPHAEGILLESDPAAFTFTDEAASWRGHAVRTEDLENMRRELAISFGSCSFEEPIADLEELGWL